MPCHPAGPLTPEHGLQLEALSEQVLASKHVQPKPRTGHGHDKPSHVPEEANRACPHEGEQNVVVLRALVLVHSLHLGGSAKQRVATATGGDDVIDESLLAVVGGQDGNLAGRVFCRVAGEVWTMAVVGKKREGGQESPSSQP